MRIRPIILWLVALLVLVTVNVLAFQRERQATEGQMALVELQPVDPRSLLQGDYMELRYAICRQAQTHVKTRDGFIVVRVDGRNVAHYVRVHDPAIALADDELLLRYRQRAYDIRIGSQSFFFQEGMAHLFTNARYAELRVSRSGDVLVVGLRDGTLQVLGPR
jgi:uncharacterized membrane-anchored protein